MQEPRTVYVSMASSHAGLPASKQIVLEIQLNKLIHDFLFSEAEGSNTSSACQSVSNTSPARQAVAEGQDKSWNTESRLQDAVNAMATSVQTGNPAEDLSSLANVAGANGASSVAAGRLNVQSPVAGVSNAPKEREDVPAYVNNGRCSARALNTEEVRLDIPEKTRDLCGVDDVPQHANKLKVFRLSKSHSVASQLFCFATGRQGENIEKQDKGRSAGGSIKLTRIGSLPCHSKLHSEADKGCKPTCKKPPKPPRSPLDNKGSAKVLSRHASGDAILLLRGASKRARLERRKRHNGPSSSNASIWALILTFLFALAMLGEGFWSLHFPLLAFDQSANTTTTNSGMITTTINSDIKLTTSMERTRDDLVHASTQREKEMQMREFWILKGLDPT